VIFERASQLRFEESCWGISGIARLGRLRMSKAEIYCASKQKASRPWLSMTQNLGKDKK
jgi:hypothetical protein